jgi:hypothetical protein
MVLSGLVAAAQGADEGAKIKPCPVTVEKVNLGASGCDDPWYSCLQVTYTNSSNLQVEGLVFGVSYWDELLSSPSPEQMLASESSVRIGKKATGTWNDGLYVHNLSKGIHVKLRLIKVAYGNELFWSDSMQDCHWEFVAN